MLDQSIMQQGMDLMLFGMGTVFVFLTLLVLCTAGMSFVINTFFPVAEVNKAASTPAAGKARGTGESVKPEILQAIQKALAEHRAKR